MPAFGFSPATVTPSEGFTPLEAGKYLFAATASEGKSTKAPKKGGYLQVTFKVLEGPHKGKTHTERFMTSHENTEVVRIAQEAISAWAHSCHKPSATSSEELHNIPFIGEVTHKPSSDGKGVDVRIAKWFDAQNNQNGKPASGAAGAAAGFAQPVAAVPTGAPASAPIAQPIGVPATVAPPPPPGSIIGTPPAAAAPIVAAPPPPPPAAAPAPAPVVDPTADWPRSDCGLWMWNGSAWVEAPKPAAAPPPPPAAPAAAPAPAGAGDPPPDISPEAWAAYQQATTAAPAAAPAATPEAWGQQAAPIAGWAV